MALKRAGVEVSGIILTTCRRSLTRVEVRTHSPFRFSPSLEKQPPRRWVRPAVSLGSALAAEPPWRGYLGILDLRRIFSLYISVDIFVRMFYVFILAIFTIWQTFLDQANTYTERVRIVNTVVVPLVCKCNTDIKKCRQFSRAYSSTDEKYDKPD